MSWKDAMHEAIAMLLREQYKLDAVSVTGVTQKREYGGYCDTCYYEYDVADIAYLDSEGKARNYRYDGSITDLMYNIT